MSEIEYQVKKSLTRMAKIAWGYNSISGKLMTEVSLTKDILIIYYDCIHSTKFQLNLLLKTKLISTWIAIKKKHLKKTYIQVKVH